MIARADIVALSTEWSLREDVVEKDYVLGWVLWGVGQDDVLRDAWVFKGGTCLKKCYIETYRFSEDLDFTVLPGGPLSAEDVLPALHRVLDRVGEESGVDFSVAEPRLKARPSGAEGSIYYRGPRGAPTPARIKIDLTGTEAVVRPSVLRTIAHPFPDRFPSDGVVRCYSLEEVFAEKVRAMGERGRPRDLYDIVNLFRRGDFREHGPVIHEVLAEKCQTKGVPVPSLMAIESSPHRVELESEWENMLGHQLPALPPLQSFLDELPALFGWLEGTAEVPALVPVRSGRDEDTTWSPPPTAWSWGIGVPLETVRFAGANHLCIELGYHGSLRVIEPYSLRRTQAGNLLLHGIRVDNGEHRSYRVDEIESVRVTNRPFRPAFAVEFASSGPISAPHTAARVSPRSSSRKTSSGKSRRPGGRPVHIISCNVCGKRFERVTRSLTINPHKATGGWQCTGRSGYFVETRY